MVGYHTPFNPLPPLGETAKYWAARDGKIGRLEPYGLDIWELDIGKVLSIGWRELGSPCLVDHMRRTNWETAFESALGNVFANGETNNACKVVNDEAASAQPAPAKPVRRPRTRRRPAV